MNYDHRLHRAIQAYTRGFARNVCIVNGKYTREQERRVLAVLKQAKRVAEERDKQLIHTLGDK